MMPRYSRISMADAALNFDGRAFGDRPTCRRALPRAVSLSCGECKEASLRKAPLRRRFLAHAQGLDACIEGRFTKRNHQRPCRPRMPPPQDCMYPVDSSARGCAAPPPNDNPRRWPAIDAFLRRLAAATIEAGNARCCARFSDCLFFDTFH